MFILTEGKQIIISGTYDECLYKLQKIQSQSVSRALENGGYNIYEVIKK